MSAIVEVLARVLGDKISPGDIRTLEVEFAKIGLDTGGRVRRIENANILIEDGIQIINPETGKVDIRIDTGGINFIENVATSEVDTIRYYAVYRGNERHKGQISSDWGGVVGGNNNLWIIAHKHTGDPWDRSQVILNAHDYTTGKDCRLYIKSNGEMDVDSADLRVVGAYNLKSEGGLAVGNLALVPDKGVIMQEEITEPAAPAANQGKLYLKDVGGKTALYIRFASGASQQIAIQP